MAIINGTPRDAAGKTLLQFLEEEGFDPKRVVVEKNLEIIPGDRLVSEVICAEDQIEILCFVGGG